MTRKGILFVISGPSGVGKGTIKDILLSEIDNLRLSISTTTRSPRSGEIEGKDYFFVDKDTFENMVKEDQFLEWAKVYHNLYGTPKHFVLDCLQNGQDILLEIDIQGALQVKEKLPQGVFIFIYPPNVEEVARRLVTRAKDSLESIDIRLAACKLEMEQVKYYDYVVVNDNLEDAVEKVKSIINAERCKVNNLELR